MAEKQALPPAPYPPETRAKGWRFELDMEQVQQSDTWALASPAMRPWLLMLWATAWAQKPCGSLPADDALVAARIGMDAKAFIKNRAVLMRGWWQADDGRLYHCTMTDRVQAMLVKKEKDRARKAGWRQRQSDGAAQDGASVTEESRGTDAGQKPDSGRKDDTKHQAPSTRPEADASGGAASAPRPARKCPKSFEPTDPQAWIDEHCPGVDWQRETDKFRDHTFKSAISDWLGAWRNWMRRAFESRRPAASVVPINRQEALEARNRAVGEAWLREQEAADARQ